jgi:hypothetical protein
MISCSTSRLIRGLPGRRRGLRAVEFAGDKLAIPAQGGVRSRYGGDVGKDLAAEPMTDLT